MSGITYREVFAKAFGSPARVPYSYQCRLACGPEASPDSPETLASGAPCRSMLIEVPTGLGKTAAVVLAWLWNRVLQPNEEARTEWPRRLVYCLPMRTLVEQTRDNVQEWLKNLAKKCPSPELQWLAANSPIILMGGEGRTDWDIYPEREAILIGTQDMLLSRALNRGYGMSRYRWPMHFGLLNNDCLWIIDETQLMGPGLATACQLEAFRLPVSAGNSTTRLDSFPGGNSVTWYASATGNREHLKTRGWRGIERSGSFYFGLTDAEIAAPSGPIAERLRATKSLTLNAVRNFGNKQKAPDSDLVSDIQKQHKAMLDALVSAPPSLPRRSLIICNTVDRAIAVHAIIKKLTVDEEGLDLMLMHSRFRLTERRSQVERLKLEYLAKYPLGQIIVATQVIEAGVDISSAILWSEIAPLASLVQRLGRLNRSGEFGFGGRASCGFNPKAIVVGIESPDPDNAEEHSNREQKEKGRRDAERAHLPYDREKCKTAWASLNKLSANASPYSLNSIAKNITASIECCSYSLQRHELLDFFDTDANLSLGFADVSPFVRGIDPESDIYVLWRDWASDDGGKPTFWPDYQDKELCPVPIGKAKDGEARKILNGGWLWRGKESDWTSIRMLGEISPGMTILLPTSAGGYDTASGWNVESETPVVSCYIPSDGQSDDDLLSYLANGWQSIAQHTADVASEASEMSKDLQSVPLFEDVLKAIHTGIQWHDLGKAHEGWRSAAVAALSKAGIPEVEKQYLPLAKFSLSESPHLWSNNGNTRLLGDELKQKIRELRSYFRPGVAHEVASALAFRLHEQSVHGLSRSIESLLAEYLIMSHHGHVRKVLRDEIPQSAPSAKDSDTVRGVTDGDPIPVVMINGNLLGGGILSTECRRMGRDKFGHESYTRSVLRLLAHYGPFHLAYFETLFRAADMRASKLAANS